MEPINKCSMCEGLLSYISGELVGPEVVIGKNSSEQAVHRLCIACYEDVVYFIEGREDEGPAELDGENLQRTDRSEVE
jgi:hypothetical protein